MSSGVEIQSTAPPPVLPALGHSWWHWEVQSNRALPQNVSKQRWIPEMSSYGTTPVQQHRSLALWSHPVPTSSSTSGPLVIPLLQQDPPPEMS